MKKVTGLIGAAILAGGLLAGCSSDSENAAPEEDTVEETTVPAETEETQEAEQTAEDAAGSGSESTENAAEEVDEATQDAQDSLGEAADAVEEEAADMGETVEEGANDVQESIEKETEESSVEGTEATGTFNGLADPHTVEIEVDGVPNAYQVEAGSEMMEKFEAMEAGASVTFVYAENGEQLVINEVK
ncbi:hypothetical protein [Domibacillus iocasae]|uniref:Uncharacterized protein n=1 Tax=Domibacillus iocasae TaxID=1714016 RepID=A0A1E7DRC4_9BACI|nr:hypothetical protein [Domibacillus iocasae]OES45613.1 hypothetical protein BA724_02035 [Domibacillus iocasae]